MSLSASVYFFLCAYLWLSLYLYLSICLLICPPLPFCVFSLSLYSFCFCRFPLFSISFSQSDSLLEFAHSLSLSLPLTHISSIFISPSLIHFPLFISSSSLSLPFNFFPPFTCNFQASEVWLRPSTRKDGHRLDAPLRATGERGGGWGGRKRKRGKGIEGRQSGRRGAGRGQRMVSSPSRDDEGILRFWRRWKPTVDDPPPQASSCWWNASFSEMEKSYGPRYQRDFCLTWIKCCQTMIAIRMMIIIQKGSNLRVQ